MRRRITLLLAALPLILTIGWAAAGAALAGGGCHPSGAAPMAASEGASAVIRIDGCMFGPSVARVPVGTEVRWLNPTKSSHDVVGKDHEWGTDLLDSGASFSHRFARPGVYPYSCSLHPGMAGVVVVGQRLAAAAEVAADDIAPVAATTPIEPAAQPASPLPWLATGGLGLLVGLVIGAAIVGRRSDPA